MNLGRGIVGGIAKGFACSRWVRDAALATLLSIIAAASWATPVGWAGVAWIKSLGGQPAICIPQGATQDFPVVRLALAESYVSHGAVWMLRLKSGAAARVLTSGECMSFGKALPGYEFSGGFRPIAFKDGSFYSIVINRVNDEEHYNRSYFATFCAKRKAGGELDYIQYDESASGATVKSAATRSQSDMPAPQVRDIPRNLPWLLSPGECVVLGEKLPGYAEDDESALVRLDRNFTYVFMVDQVSDSGHYNFFYSVVFCVGVPSSEAVEYVQYRRDSAGRVFVPYCDAALNGNSR